MSTREPFRRCERCRERKHPYLFPLNRKTGSRGSVCLACIGEEGMRRMEQLRNRRRGSA